MPAVAQLDVDVIGVDWRSVCLRYAACRARQGRAEAISIRRPCLLRRPSCTGTSNAVLDEAGAAPGHIFNLGHGIWPDTDPDAVARLVDYVHERR